MVRPKLRLGWADAKLNEPVERYVAVDNAFNAMLFDERLPAGLVLVKGSRNPPPPSFAQYGYR